MEVIRKWHISKTNAKSVDGKAKSITPTTTISIQIAEKRDKIITITAKPKTDRGDMKAVIFIFIFLGIWFLSAAVHESDLSRNFNKTGDAKAWFFEIKR